jgi:hypothetical protein
VGFDFSAETKWKTRKVKLLRQEAFPTLALFVLINTRKTKWLTHLPANR